MGYGEEGGKIERARKRDMRTNKYNRDRHTSSKTDWQVGRHTPIGR